MRPRFVVGIDTGGSYTDAAVIGLSDGRVAATAKALTTKGDLSIGIVEALRRVLSASRIAPADIAQVSLSTTLATNAIVEGHGSALGVILIGFDRAMEERAAIAGTLPGTRVLRVRGGHNHAGDQAQDLDEEAVRAFVRETAGEVEAYAVAAHYSVRNPEHEQRVGALIGELAGVPVSLSCDLAQALDAPRRALTAALNARIISRITGLLGALRESLCELGIAAPVMVVKGDGSLETADAAASRPIETILSGPAASLIGAKFLSGLSDFVVADIGGTTTDIAAVQGGWPRLVRDGAEVGGRRTMVQAVDMRSFGLGGDSEVEIDFSGRVLLKPRRLVPLALLGQRFPATIDQLRAMCSQERGAAEGARFVLRPLGFREGASPVGLAQRDRDLLAKIGAEPLPLGTLARGPTERRALERLTRLGLAQLAGFTPSDAAHVLGLQDQWSREAARLGALLLRRGQGAPSPDSDQAAREEARALAQAVFEAVVARSARALIESLAGAPLTGAEPLIAALAAGEGRIGGLDVRVRPAHPVVGVGGPAPVFYPSVGQRLGARMLLPEHGAAANAVGAAIGVVRARVVVNVTSPMPGLWRLHHRGAPVAFEDPGRALAEARALARAEALERASAAGVGSAEVEIHVDRVDLPGATGEAGLVGAVVTAECWGKPAD